MSTSASRAYAFTCDRSLAAILEALNASGPRAWEMRERARYGDYLNAVPAERVRVRVHAFPQSGEYGLVHVGRIGGVGFREGYTGLLQVGAASAACAGRD